MAVPSFIGISSVARLPLHDASKDTFPEASVDTLARNVHNNGVSGDMHVRLLESVFPQKWRSLSPGIPPLLPI